MESHMLSATTTVTTAIGILRTGHWEQLELTAFQGLTGCDIVWTSASSFSGLRLLLPGMWKHTRG